MNNKDGLVYEFLKTSLDYFSRLVSCFVLCTTLV